MRKQMHPLTVVTLPLSLAALALLIAAPAGAACILGSPATWNIPGNGSWSTDADWNPMTFPNSASTNVCITNGSSTVTLDTTASVASLQLGSGNGLTLQAGTTLLPHGPQIINDGNLTVSGGGTLIEVGTVTLSGGGMLTLNTTSGGGAAVILTAGSFTNQSTIQGAGVIQGAGGPEMDVLALNNDGNGKILANASGQTLSLNGGFANNLGLMEATNGGVLNINNVRVGNAGGMISASSSGVGTTLQIDGGVVSNGGGTIRASGSGATLLLSGNIEIQGGTLSNEGGAFFGARAGTVASLDGSTAAGPVTIEGTYTGDFASQTALRGSIVNKGNLQINGGNGVSTSLLIDSSNVTLSGGGTVILATLDLGGSASIGASGGSSRALTNVDNTIQGGGLLLLNDMTLLNEATINANRTADSPLLLIEGGNVTNTGLMEATNRGLLSMSGVAVNNGGGTISANGSAASVALAVNTVIQGGALTNNGAAFFGTLAGQVASLDGSTGAGAVTLNGTYTGDLGSSTYLLGSIVNKGNLQLNSNGANTLLLIGSNVTLSGGGTVTLSTQNAGGNAFILEGAPLTNVDNTIQGNGIIDQDGSSLVNQTRGTILANVPRQALFLSGGGSITNNGTFQVNSGTALVAQDVVLTNYAANTLTAGTYIVSGTSTSPGVLEVDSVGIIGGEIVNNAAAIVLNGPNSLFIDAAGLDTLANFTNNTGAGSFTISGGRNLTTPGDFANAGTMTVGSGSTLQIGNGTNAYIESGGRTQGSGTIAGNVVIRGGSIMGGTPASPGALAVNGNYAQGLGGTMIVDLGGTGGGEFSVLSITGTASLDGTVDFVAVNGFLPAGGDEFTFLNFGTQSGNFANMVFTDFSCPSGFSCRDVFGSGTLTFEITKVSGAPEPGSLALFGPGLGALLALAKRRRNRLARTLH